MNPSHGTWPGLKIHTGFGALAWSCAIAAAGVIIPAQTADWIFFGELMVHWTVHAASLLVIPLIIWRREPIHCLALLALCALALWPWLIAAWSPRSQPTAAPKLTVASFNLHIGNPTVAADLPALRNCAAEIVVLIEVDAADQASLRGDQRWPYQHWEPRGERSLGLALLSQQPVASFVVQDLAGTPAIEACLVRAGQPLHVLAVHPHAPISPASWRLRDRQFKRIVELVTGINGPVVVLGDFNSTVADPAWRALLADTGLQRAAGRAPATWPAHLGVCGIAIDHVLAAHGAQVGSLSAVSVQGSDHRGVVASIILD